MTPQFLSLKTGTLEFLVIAFVSASTITAQQSLVDSSELKRTVIEAFKLVHDGYSSDEVILQTELNDAFVAACRDKLPNVEAAHFNWTLLNLRKAGKLAVKTTRRETRRYDHATPIAEMVARMMEDRHGKSIDRIMADPVTRNEFNQAATRIDADVETYLVRKAAFRLRKTRKLRPELITRIADWGRVVSEYEAADLATSFDSIPSEPGIYLFRDASGYLYIGEAIDLRKRLEQHLGGSDRKSLANYLADQGFANITVEIHTFEPGSRISEIMVRRAYESELIRSRRPKFNVRP